VISHFMQYRVLAPKAGLKELTKSRDEDRQAARGLHVLGEPIKGLGRSAEDLSPICGCNSISSESLYNVADVRHRICQFRSVAHDRGSLRRPAHDALYIIYNSSLYLLYIKYAPTRREVRALADDDHGVRLEADSRAHLTPTKQAAIMWPLPADRRLDQLVELANEAGAATRRNELAAALVADATTSSEELLQLVLAWRRALVRDVVIDVPPGGDVTYLPRYGPGRRRRGNR
jgi:hypothetical protein